MSATFEDKEALDLYIRDVNNKKIWGKCVSDCVVFCLVSSDMSKVRWGEMRRRARDADKRRVPMARCHRDSLPVVVVGIPPIEPEKSTGTQLKMMN